MDATVSLPTVRRQGAITVGEVKEREIHASGEIAHGSIQQHEGPSACRGQASQDPGSVVCGRSGRKIA
jgi:hypothetical protein